jgi:predicted nucleotide-binding protein (sugar kinase/HSP70/actin superfamily)
MGSCSSIKPQQSSIDLNYLGAEKSQWRDTVNQDFTKEDIKNTILLFGGMTILQDRLVMAALEAKQEQYIALPNPDFESFRTGKAYGNRGQCNPTYFTVGNLVKYLKKIQKEKGLTSEEIVKKYAYVTANGCGPCRFGMYITEYRKALTDAGFAGFRVFSFEHNKITNEDGSQSELNLSPALYITPIKAVLIGDILNILKHKIRPYELESGTTDDAFEACYDLLSDALKEGKNLLFTLWKCRKILKKIKLDRLQAKPKVMIVGEFWAAMTEGDGNYNLHKFLESEGAESIPQPIINRLMLSIWESTYFFDKKLDLEDETKKGYFDFESTKRRIITKLLEYTIRSYFTLYAKAIGLYDYQLPDIEALSRLSRVYFPLDAEGGEGHMEVAHLLESIHHNLAHMVISVKPFGCMPSSAVSDGIQSLVTSHYPSANFLSIETSGEGAANFYSRVQMALFKAKQSAKEEWEAMEIPTHIPEKVHNYLYQPKNQKIGTAAQLIESLLE